LVEKPLCLTKVELKKIKEFYENNDGPILMTGFNRRFAPVIQFIKSKIIKRSNPMIINYFMNAGYIDYNHWVHKAEGGGRNIGEACHIYDLFIYLTESSHYCLSVNSITPNNKFYSKKDNFTVSIKFKDGTVANLIYTSMGNKAISKENMIICWDGNIIEMDNYFECKVNGETKFKNSSQNKGHKEEVEYFAEGIINKKFPISISDQFEATQISFLVEDQMNR
jgi:predicted dehydrogenase